MFDDAVTDSSVSVERIQKFGTFKFSSFPQCHGGNACKKEGKNYLFIPLNLYFNIKRRIELVQEHH